MKKRFAKIAIALLLGAAAPVAVGAFSQFFEEVAGLGRVDFIDQVLVSNIKTKIKSGASNDEVKATMESKDTTEADYLYTVDLILDGDVADTATVSWTSAQIPGQSQSVTFSGLELGTVSTLEIKVTR